MSLCWEDGGLEFKHKLHNSKALQWFQTVGAESSEFEFN